MLGSDLALQLSARHEVVGAGRRPAPHLSVPFHIMNLGQSKVVMDFIKREKPDVILHAAAKTEVDECETERRAALAENFESTRFVTDAGNQINAAIIYFSTDFVFDGTSREPYKETDRPRPLSVYGETKLLAERYLMLRGRRFLILRTSWLFGKYGDNFPKKILRKAEEGKVARVVEDEFGNPTFTADLAGAVAELLNLLPKADEKKMNQIYHVTNEGTVSRFGFARAILKKKNLAADLVIPMPRASAHYAAARPQNSALATEKIKSEFGIRLRSWEEALDAFLQEDLAPLTQ